jgi:hypothetical protein
MKTGHWTTEEYDYLREHYLEEGSAPIGRALDRNPRSVSCMAHWLGLKRGWGNKPRFRRYSVNEDIFKSWTMESAYLIGLIITDGNLTERELSIHSKDIELLEKVRNALSSEHPVSLCTGKNLYRIRIGNKNMIADLKSMGITENKSKTVTMPYIPAQFFFDFLRGYIDGDGMIKLTRHGGLIMKLTTGSPFNLDDISDTITRLLGIERHIPVACTQKRRETISTWYELTYCGKCASLICEAIYSHCDNLYLSRKRQAYLSYLSRPKLHGDRNNGNATKYHSS